MKKILATLLASTMALSAVGALVACNGGNGGTPAYDDPWDHEITGTWSVPEEDGYYFAGSPKYYSDEIKAAGTENNGWGNDDGETMATIADELKFEQNSDNTDLWRVTLNLYKNDDFKIRYTNSAWDEIPGISKLSADSNLLGKLNTATSAIYAAEEGLGGTNFVVREDGLYEIRINTAPKDKSIVTYYRKGNAAVVTTEYAVDIAGGHLDSSWQGTLRTESVTNPTGETTKEVEVALEAGDEFKPRVVAKLTKGEVVGDWGPSTWISATHSAIEGELPEGLQCVEGGDNWSCTESATYKIAVTFDEAGTVTKVVVTKVPAAA